MNLVCVQGCMDKTSAVAIVTMDHYSALNALVLYYQMVSGIKSGGRM